MSTANPTLFNPTQLILELDQTALDRAWQHQNAASSSSCWQKYLNQVTLDAFLPWLQTEEDATAKVGFDRGSQADIWEVVNGSLINIDGAKLVLIPSEAEDLSELRVPQEWIDIPEWTADYYLAVQVNVDDRYIRIWGYATHQQLKQGNLDYGDRTYSLDDTELITDINVLWVARELCSNEVTRAAVEPIETITDAQVESLIQRLGSQSQLLPRLAVSFATWAALIQNPRWCRRLAATRRGETAKTPVLQWLQQGMANIASNFGWRPIEMTLSAEGAKGVATSIPTSEVPVFGLAKQIAIGDRFYELRVLPLDERGWRFELCCITPGCVILPGVKLRLLTEDFQSFEGNEDVATEPVELLFVELNLDPGESLVWQIEPTPNDYQQEILQF